MSTASKRAYLKVLVMETFMRHIKMLRVALAAFVVALTLSSTFAADDPAANWAFTNKWWAYKSGSYYYATNALNWKIMLENKTAYNNLKNGVFEFRSTGSSFPTSLKTIGEGGILDMRNIVVNDNYPIINMKLGLNAFRGSTSGFDKFLVNNCGTIKGSLFYSSMVKEAYLEGDATTIPINDNKYFAYQSSLTNLVFRLPDLKSITDYGFLYACNGLKHLEISSTNLVAISAGSINLTQSQTAAYKAQPETLTFLGVAQSDAFIKVLLNNVSGVPSTSETGKKTIIYVSKKKKWGWKASGLIKPLEGNEVNIAPEGCLGVYVVGTARKAWFVHKDSPWEDYKPGFQVIVQ